MTGQWLGVHTLVSSTEPSTERSTNESMSGASPWALPEGFEAQDSEPEDLRDHLLWQLNLTSMSARDRAIGVTIIEAIDDDGYLHESDETLQSNLAGLYRVGADEIEAVRHRIQQFDPLGVGSRSLSECLCVQLDACDPQTPGWHAAKAIAAEHLEELARNDRTRLCRQLKVDADGLDAAIALIRSLDLHAASEVVGRIRMVDGVTYTETLVVRPAQ